MKTTVIPAQITTVEDTIAGNLNFTQILLLVSSLFINTFIYVLVPIQLHFTPAKVLLMLIVMLTSIVLALKIKQRLVLHWILIISTYLLRPHIYVFNKNTYAGRIILPKTQKSSTKIKKQKNINVVKKILDTTLDYTQYSKNTDISIQFKRKKLVFIKNYE